MTDTPATPTKKAVTKKVTKVVKADNVAKSATASDKVPAKRTRKSNPVFAKVTLGVLRELLGNDDSVEVTVSRNFVLDKKKAQIEDLAAKELGI